MDRFPEEKAKIIQKAARQAQDAQQEAEENGGTRGPPEKYSIGEIKGEKKKYGAGVVLDTDIFEGVRQRDWGKTLGTYIYENMAGAELTMFDEDGNPEVVYLARENDRVKKDGTKNSHKVLDKLAGYRGDTIRAKAIVQLDEVLETSRSKETTEDHSHQWLDAHGWIIRNAYLQDESGNIYEATLNIANGKDRKILYEVNRVHQIDKIKSPGEHTVTDNGQRFRYQKPGTGGAQSETKDNINENAANVKEHFSISEDSDARQLTEAQQEFFKGSKAVDSEGRHEGGSGGYRSARLGIQAEIRGCEKLQRERKIRLKSEDFSRIWSECRDSNPRPLGPEGWSNIFRGYFKAFSHISAHKISQLRRFRHG